MGVITFKVFVNCPGKDIFVQEGQDAFLAQLAKSGGETKVEIERVSEPHDADFIIVDRKEKIPALLIGKKYFLIILDNGKTEFGESKEGDLDTETRMAIFALTVNIGCRVGLVGRRDQ